jgi:uncharacterized damage-inducible protein DinB
MMPLSDLPPHLIPVWKRCRETHEALLDCLTRFPEDRFTWRPAPCARTAAEIIAHVARGECLYALCLKPNAPGQPPIAYPGTEEAAVPGSLVPKDRDSSLHVIELAFDFAARVVSGATEADLERVAADDWNPLGPEVEGPLTGLWFIEQMNRHKAYHLGQLWYLISMLEEPPAA